MSAIARLFDMKPVESSQGTPRFSLPKFSPVRWDDLDAARLMGWTEDSPSLKARLRQMTGADFLKPSNRNLSTFLTSDDELAQLEPDDVFGSPSHAFQFTTDWNSPSGKQTRPIRQQIRKNSWVVDIRSPEWSPTDVPIGRCWSVCDSRGWTTPLISSQSATPLANSRGVTPTLFEHRLDEIMTKSSNDCDSLYHSLTSDTDASLMSLSDVRARPNDWLTSNDLNPADDGRTSFVARSRSNYTPNVAPSAVPGSSRKHTTDFGCRAQKRSANEGASIQFNPVQTRSNRVNPVESGLGWYKPVSAEPPCSYGGGTMSSWCNLQYKPKLDGDTRRATIPTTDTGSYSKGYSEDQPERGTSTHETSSLPSRPQTFRKKILAIRSSLEDKVAVLRREKKMLDEKIRAAKEEEVLRLRQLAKFHREVNMTRKEILLRTIEKLKQNLGRQGIKLQKLYDIVLIEQRESLNRQ